jgi:hypothetical protein
MTTTPTPASAKLELALLNAQAASLDNQETYVFLQEAGFSPDAAIRLRELLDVTRKIGEQVISIGKIVVMKLIEFSKANPNLAAGVALGATVSVLASSLPIFGQILAPLTALLGITVGAVLGYQKDQEEKGRRVSEAPAQYLRDAIATAQLFFRLFIDIIGIVTGEPRTSEEA